MRTPERATARPPIYDLGPDALLLSHLVRDGRASFEDLAATLGTSRQTAWRRVRSLANNVLWGFTSVLDHQALGWRHYVLTLPGAPDRQAVRRIEDAVTAVTATGRFRLLDAFLLHGAQWRMVLRIVARSSLTLETFLQGLRERLPGTQWHVEEVEMVLREAGVANPDRDGLLDLVQRDTEEVTP